MRTYCNVVKKYSIAIIVMEQTWSGLHGTRNAMRAPPCTSARWRCWWRGVTAIPTEKWYETAPYCSEHIEKAGAPLPAWLWSMKRVREEWVNSTNEIWYTKASATLPKAISIEHNVLKKKKKLRQLCSGGCKVRRISRVGTAKRSKAKL